MKKLLFLYNPHAGKAKIKNNLSGILEVLSEAGYDLTVYPTKKPKDATEVVEKRGAEFDVIVCSGGDGTLDEVVSGVRKCGKRVPIGYIPAGSTNDFGSSIGVPVNMTDAAKVVAGGKTFNCDIGSFNDSDFVYVAAFGTFTEVSYMTPQSAKNALGHAAYILEALKKLPELKTFKLKVEYNDWEVDDEFLMGMVTNSTSVGGFKNLVEGDVELNDGLLEVTFIRSPANSFVLNELMIDLLNGTNESGCILRTHTKEIKVTCQEEMAWTLDGEFGGAVKTANIACIPAAIDIFCEINDV